jgi:hypothetical protein
MFPGKARAYPSEAPFRCSNLRYALLWKYVIYGQKKFYNIGPIGLNVIKLFTSVINDTVAVVS